MLLPNCWAKCGPTNYRNWAGRLCKATPSFFSSTHRAPASEAAKAENTALHQRHRDRERERNPTIWQAKAVTVPLLTGCCVVAEEGRKHAWCSEQNCSGTESIYCGAFCDEPPPKASVSAQAPLASADRGNISSLLPGNENCNVGSANRKSQGDDNSPFSIISFSNGPSQFCLFSSAVTLRPFCSLQSVWTLSHCSIHYCKSLQLEIIVTNPK